MFVTDPFGTFLPGALDRAVLRATRSLPNTWMGLRAAILLRRLTVAWRRGTRPIDTDVFGMRMRLYPRGNGCEKGALFTPQMYEVPEREFLSGEISRARRDGRRFRFVDVGANVGLFSFAVASLAGPEASILAIEPQPVVRDRLAYNLSLNPGADIRHIAVAVADRDADVELHIDERDLGGTRVGGRGTSVQTATVRARRLGDVLSEEGFDAPDVLKIDIEGLEDIVLSDFLADTSDERLPRAIIIDNSSTVWSLDVFGLLRDRGYAEAGRGHQNVFFRR